MHYQLVLLFVLMCIVLCKTGNMKMSLCRSHFSLENATRLPIEMWLLMNGTGMDNGKRTVLRKIKFVFLFLLQTQLVI